MTTDETRRSVLATLGLGLSAGAFGVVGADAQSTDEHAPPVAWVREHRRGQAGDAAAVVSQSDGGAAVAATVDREQGMSTGWVFGVDAAGRRTWGTTVSEKPDTELTAATRAHGGGVVVAGYTQRPDAPTTRTPLLASVANGETQWVRTVNPTSWNAEARSVRRDGDGGYVVAGRAFSGGSQQALVFRVDDGGGVDWSQSFEPGSVNYLYGVVPLDDGYAAAGFTDAGSGDDWRGWVLRLSSSGDVWWEKRFRGDDGHAHNVLYDLTPTIVGFKLVGVTAPSDALERRAWSVTLDRTGERFGQRVVDGPTASAFYGVTRRDDTVVHGGRVRETEDGAQHGWVLATNEATETIWEQRPRGPVDGRVDDVVRTTDGGYVFVGETNPADQTPAAPWVGKVGGRVISPTPSPSRSTTSASTGGTTGTGTRTGTDAGTPTGTETTAATPLASPSVSGETTGEIVGETTSDAGPGFGALGALAGLGGLLWRRYDGSLADLFDGDD